MVLPLAYETQDVGFFFFMKENMEKKKECFIPYSSMKADQGK